MLIDTHTHLNFKVFSKNIDKIISSAEKSGVIGFIVPGTNVQTSRSALLTAQKFKNVYSAVGIHPHDAEDELALFDPDSGNSQLQDILEKLANNKKIIAIGECGLDNYQKQLTPDMPNLQKSVFDMQVKLALKLKLPLIVHNRQADSETIAALEKTGFFKSNLRLVFHSFEGQKKIFDLATKFKNIYLGINALITYHLPLQKIAGQIPLEKIVLETDSPFLRPRNTKKTYKFPNTPGNVKIVAQSLAEINNTSQKIIERITTDNASRLFQINF